MNRFLAKAAVAAAAFCLMITAPAMAAAQDKLGGTLEIFSWWAGDEGPALEAMIKLYNKQHPGVSVENAAVTGGSGINARAVLKTRMLGGNPPDSFQVHAGQELIGTWVASGRMEDLTFLYKQQGWMEAFPADLIKLIGTENGIWSVPVTVHRSNVMWFVPANLKKWGIQAPADWNEFLEIAPRLQEQGVVPLALATNWTANHLWESVALASMGADRWDALWRGEIPWTDPEVVKAWELFGKVLQYTNDDATSLSWQQATDMVVDGRAAFNVMGDWAAGYMNTTLGMAPGKDFGWSASPGTGGVFMFLSDSFGLPVGAANRDNSLAWLALVGSRSGSDAFNPLKGSISPRLDTDLNLYNDYSKSAAGDWGRDRIVGSLAHGVTANEGFMSDFASVMEMYLKNRNAGQAAMACHAIAVKNGIARR
ncbi:extracellular solute-binding protein family 1 [Oleidesulfovibrio alaskensis G20]|jgi:glucose/mannose transport system substrate-binding protein|uniref:Probable sugar-binding periplasmic protein n=1 Tax=Oleidesulfovibrio alaskensis (strain ATCC BAA-1058 / DSM 17464 / G20) TaxID=207559 RepID=Q30V46_OLEA2|nr:ABC transporter substrate-binding protein [Oleidesulfovibrio alaskensis]ABB40450.1 extracellular solute-binding protein family 1 [Oleidesulfovibrio alaskensis G20]MBG0772708.1 carbohydrate ABC transporter substrate-binding protein [Oleidesulfovibrio alaskensis]MBL3581943.1 carbohydrate ABC transporter substrate-binding protein [Oleidesulfovibrio alaskensis]